MLCLVHKVNREVRAGLFIYKELSLSVVFPSLAFGSLLSFRREADLAGMFFVPASLFTGGGAGKESRFLITPWVGGAESEKKFQPARQCLSPLLPTPRSSLCH